MTEKVEYEALMHKISLERDKWFEEIGNFKLGECHLHIEGAIYETSYVPTEREKYLLEKLSK